jgi:uncharacterized membrane protein YeaQ/YmgE (transglycosylase-associated protein family)
VIVVVVLLALVVLLVLGWVIVGLVFKLLWWALIGLAIGALARAILPGRQRIGLLMTAGVGIAGSLLGGILARAFGWGGIVQFLLAIALAAAAIVLLEGRRPARA